MRWRHSSVVRHLGLYLWRSKQAVTNVQLGYWNEDIVYVLCVLFLFCFLLQNVLLNLCAFKPFLFENAHSGAFSSAESDCATRIENARRCKTPFI